jgi:hypothetical protein
VGVSRGISADVARRGSAVPSLLLVAIPTETWVAVIAVDLLVRVLNEMW